jgi:hypothetical protein
MISGTFGGQGVQTCHDGAGVDAEASQEAKVWMTCRHYRAAKMRWRGEEAVSFTQADH